MAKSLNNNERTLVAQISELAAQVPEADKEHFLWMLKGIVFATKSYGEKSN